MRTSKPDVNYYSVSNNIGGYFEGSDHPSDTSPVPDGSLITDKSFLSDSQDYDSYLKICDGTYNIGFHNVLVMQGKENCVDLNNNVRCVSVTGNYGRPDLIGDQVITVKGGCSNIVLEGVIYSNGRNADVVIGAWSDQNLNRSSNISLLGLRRADGKPVRVVLARYDNVTLPMAHEVLWLKSIGYSIYWWAKWALVKLNIL